MSTITEAFAAAERLHHDREAIDDKVAKRQSNARTCVAIFSDHTVSLLSDFDPFPVTRGDVLYPCILVDVGVRPGSVSWHDLVRAYHEGDAALRTFHAIHLELDKNGRHQVKRLTVGTDAYYPDFGT